MGHEWVQKLKVPELKEELKKRGLSVTGNKPVLLDRLVTFLDEEDAAKDDAKDDAAADADQAEELMDREDKAAEPATGTPAAEQQEEPVSAQQEPVSATATADVQQGAEADLPPAGSPGSSPPIAADVTAAEAVDDSVGANADQGMELPAADAVGAGPSDKAESEPHQTEQSPRVEIAPSTPPVDQSQLTDQQPEVSTDAVAAPEGATAGEPAAAEPTPEHTASADERVDGVHAVERKEDTASPADAEPPALAVETPLADTSKTDIEELVAQDYEAEVDYEMGSDTEPELPAPSPKPAADAVEPNGKRSSEALDDRQGKRARLVNQPKADADKIARTASKAAGEPGPTGRVPVERPSKLQRVDSGRSVPGLGAATRAMRVEPFVRPLREQEVRELLGKHGSVADFWMPAIKTHCLVIYETLEEAQAAYTALYDMEFQPSRKLRPTFLGLEQTQADINTGKGIKPAPALAARTPATAMPATAAEELPAKRSAEKAAEAPAGPESAARDGPARESAFSRLSGSKARDGTAAAATAAPAAQRKPVPKPADPEPKALDELFRKSKTLPSIYYVVLTDEEVAEKKRKAAAAAASKGVALNGTAADPAESLPPPPQPGSGSKAGDRPLPPPPSREPKSEERRHGDDNGRAPRAHREEGRTGRQRSPEGRWQDSRR